MCENRKILEWLYNRLREMPAFSSKRAFSVKVLGKSPRYFSTLQSEGGNASSDVLNAAKSNLDAVLKSPISLQNEEFLDLFAAYYSLSSMIDALTTVRLTE